MGVDSRREHRQPAVDPLARRTRAQRDPLLSSLNAPLENSFTVVYWDQRGAGKSFYPDIPRSSRTVEQFISDLDDLVEAVCERHGKTKGVIFGHS